MPADAKIDSVASTLPGHDATYFNVPTLSEVTGPLTNKTRIRGDVGAGIEATKAVGGKVDGDVVVWASYACTGPSDTDCLTDPLPMAGDVQNIAFAARGSQVVDWSGNYEETGGKRNDDPATTGYKLPFNVGKHDYTWYNGDLGKSAKLTYDGTSKVKGLSTFRFTQDVAATTVGTIDLPGSLVGSKEPSVTGDIITTGHLEMDVEPETGVAMTTVSSPSKWVEVNGTKVLTMIDGTFSLTDATVTDNVDNYRPLALGLKTLRLWAPIGGTIVGLGLIGLGLAIGQRQRRRRGLISEASAAPTSASAKASASNSSWPTTRR